MRHLFLPAGSTNRSSRLPAAPRPLPPLLIVCVLGILILAYILLAFHPLSLAYLDYVDGYYLYVSHRMAQGAVLYTGVMGVQPPGIYLVGDAIFRLHDSLSAIRLYSLLLHALTVILVYLAGRRLFCGSGLGLVAATLFSLAPYSLVWSRTFDPNPLVTCLSLSSFVLLLARRRAGAYAAGAAGGLALATKIWYLPVGLALVLFLARRERILLFPFLAGLVAVVGMVCLIGSLSAGSAFWHGLLVQDASAPSADWLEASVIHVLADNMILLILAALGLRRALATQSLAGSPGPWFLIASCSVLGATIKTGTAWPVFQFAEPALALYAAYAILPPTRTAPIVSWSAAFDRRHIIAALGIGLVAFWSLPAIRAVGGQSDASVRSIVALLRADSKPDQSLLAPPFYLFLAGRRAIGEYADVNLWALQADNGDPSALAARDHTVRNLRAGRIPLVLQDSRVRRLGAVPDALLRGYRRLPFEDPLPADRAVEIWEPRR